VSSFDVGISENNALLMGAGPSKRRRRAPVIPDIDMKQMPEIRMSFGLSEPN